MYSLTFAQFNFHYLLKIKLQCVGCSLMLFWLTHELTCNEWSMIMKWQNNRPVYNVYPLFSHVFLSEKSAHYTRTFTVYI